MTIYKSPSLVPPDKLREALGITSKLIEFNPNHDERGQFASGGGGGGADPFHYSNYKVDSDNYEGSETHKLQIQGALQYLQAPANTKVRLVSPDKLQSDKSLAEYNRLTKEITVNREFMRETKGTAIVGIMAHELAHDDYQQFLADQVSEYQTAKQQYKKYFGKDGRLKQEYFDEFPATAIERRWGTDAQRELRKYHSTNVSAYAAQHYKQSIESTAENETLSEVARLIATGKESEVPESWLGYYKARKNYLKTRRSKK